ncbi:hypothetical protein [Dyadobacter alkalitolerans]|uniref:hypothetical protein n=1 Tax=Dyadobacter alkalitolerans TaxID=492736 RepID=UPI000423F9F4|nr:hypothetical protein [Dyadobacter alkalitolerans]
MKNPYIPACHSPGDAREQRRKYVLVYAMFVMANLVLAAHPLFYGSFVLSIQKDPASVLDSTWIYAGAYVLLTLNEWAFHGPARIMEQKLAFDLIKNFLDEMYH